MHYFYGVWECSFFYFEVEGSSSVSLLALLCENKLLKLTKTLFFLVNFVSLVVSIWRSRFKKVVEVFLTCDQATLHASRMRCGEDNLVNFQK